MKNDVIITENELQYYIDMSEIGTQACELLTRMHNDSNYAYDVEIRDLLEDYDKLLKRYE